MIDFHGRENVNEVNPDFDFPWILSSGFLAFFCFFFPLLLVLLLLTFFFPWIFLPLQSSKEKEAYRDEFGVF